MPTLFNGCGFGPPPPLTAASSWTWVDHPVSGLQCLTLRPLQTCSRSGSASSMLNLAGHRNSPDRSTKSTRFTLWCSTACKHRVSGSLSLPSRGPFHLSFTVLCAIGTGWSPRVPSRFHVSRCTLDPAMPLAVSSTGLSPSLAGFPKTVPLQLADHLCGPNPSVHARWFRLCRFRSPLLPVSMFLSLPPAT